MNLHIDGRDAPSWLVAELYAMREVVAEEYVEAWGRPPHLRELTHYLAQHFEDRDEDPAPAFGRRTKHETGESR